MISYLISFFIFFICLNNDFFFWTFYDNNLKSYDFFIYEFIFFYVLISFFNKEKEKQWNDFTKDFDFDLLFKYFLLAFKSPSFVLNLFMINVKKFFNYIIFYKYRLIINFLKVYYKMNGYKLLVWWRPLFKKTSYFGYFRSNRSKWIK